MPLTVEQFTHRLLSSGVMSEGELSDWIATVPVEKRSTDGDQLARELVREKKLTKFQAEQLYAGKEKSLTLGNYVILDKLGQGGMGMVLKARHKRMARVVALKVMSPAAVKSPDAVKRFHREVQTAAKLTHPNIVTAFDADEAKGTHFLVMEYVEGDDLSQLVKKHGPLSIEQAIECVIQAARGLTHAHAEGVIHRDIKPANLLLDKHGTVKILDMGLARLESGLSDAGGVAAAGLTQSGTIMGTVDYMSPEQAEDTRHADARADIYALGCSLYYLLTGHAVYGGETMMKKLLAHREAPIPSLVADAASIRTDAGSVGHALDSIFHKMIAKKPADRYQSMTEVIADLERCRAGQSVTMNVNAVSGESGSNYELQKFLRQISGDEAGLATSATTGPVGTNALPVNGTAETMLLTSNSAGTDPQTENSLADGRPVAGGFVAELVRVRSFGALVRILTNSATGRLASVGVVLLVLGAWWMFRTPRGTVQIEITDEQIEVTFGETGRSLRGTKSETVRLPIGEHVLHVKLGETTLDTPEITIAKEEPIEIKVEKVGNRVRVMRGKEFLVAKELARRTTGGSKVGSADATGEVVPQFALEFDGQASYVGLPNLGLSSVKPFTAEVWVRLSKLTEPADGAIVVGSGLLLSRTAKGTWIFHINGMKGDISSDTEAVVGEWVHLAAVWDGSSRALYVDGRRQQATEKKAVGKKAVDSPPRETTTELSLGGIPRVAKSAGTRFLAGQLREVRISSVARYQSEFQPAQRFAPDKNTLGLYHFDEGTGETLKDSSSNNHHGKIVAAKWVKLNNASAAAPLVDTALLFDGNSVVTIDTPADFSPTSVTVEAYVRLDAAVPRGSIYQFGNNQGLGLDFEAGTRWRLSRLVNPTGHFSAEGTSPIELGRRMHVAGVCSADKFLVFVDGKLAATSGSVRDRTFKPLTSSHRIGQQFKGLIDEVRVSKIPRYDREFTPAPRLVADKDTLALYHCDEGAGSELKDSSGNNHHGKIVGTKWVRAFDGSDEASKSEQVSSWELSGRVFLPQLNLDFTKPLTIEAFATPSEASRYHHLFSSGPPEFSLRFVRGGEWEFLGLSTMKLKSQPQSFPRRMHVAAVLDNRQARLYVDGRKVQDATCDASKLAGLNQLHPQLGRDYVGTFDEVRISQISRYDQDFTPQNRFTPDANTVALYHCDEGSGKVLKDSSGNNHHGQIDGAQWVKVGETAVGAEPYTAVMKITPHEKFPILKGHEGPIRRIRFLPDGKQFVSVARDGTARLWNVETGEQVRQFESSGSDKTLNNLAVSPDGKLLAMGGSSFRVYLFDIASGKLERFIQLKDLEHAAVGGMSFSADGLSLFIGNVPGVLHEFRVSDGSPLSNPKVLDGRLMMIEPLPDNERVLVGDWDQASIVLWNRKSQKVEQRFAWTDKYNSARSISLLSDGERFASAHSSGPVRIWSLKTGQELKRWTPHVGKAISSTDVFSLHNDRWLLTLGDDKAIRLWDGKTFEKLDEATTEKLGTGVGAVSPDARTLVTGAGWRLTTQSEYDEYHDLHVWRLSTPTPITALTPYELWTSPDYEWSAPTNLGSVINTAAGEGSPCLSADGLTLLFDSDRSGGQGKTDLWMSRRPTLTDPWSAPENLGATVNSSEHEHVPTLSSDGLALVFASDRGQADKRYKLWWCHRKTTAEPWSKPTRQQLEVTTVAGVSDYEPELSADGLTLLFTSFPRVGTHGLEDLWQCRRSTPTDPWGPVQNLGAIVNGPAKDMDPALSSDGRVLLFVSDRPGGQGKADFWLSSRPSLDAPWSAPQNLGKPVNSDVDELSPTLSADGQTLIYRSNRAGGRGGADLWMSRRIRKR